MDVGLLIPQVVVNTLSTGSTYVLMALGFTVIFGIMKVVNFAHGAVYMLGSYAVYLLYGEMGVSYWLALPLGALAVGVLGAAAERTVIRPVAADPLKVLLITLGLGLIFEAVIELTIGPNPQHVPPVATGTIEAFGAHLAWSRLVIVVAAMIGLSALYAFVKYSKWGRATRAVSQDAEIARAQGIPTERVYPLVFGGASMLAAVAGGLLAPVLATTPFIGEAALIRSFIIVVIGGMGSVPGAIIAGFAVALVENVGTLAVGAQATQMILFLLVVLILIVRPSGIGGRRLRRV